MIFEHFVTKFHKLPEQPSYMIAVLMHRRNRSPSRGPNTLYVFDMGGTCIESPIVSPHFQRIKNENMLTHLNGFGKWKFKQSFIHLTKMVVLKMIDWARLFFKKETLLDVYCVKDQNVADGDVFVSVCGLRETN